MPRASAGRYDRSVRLRGAPDFSLFEAPERVEARGDLAFETLWLNEGGEGTGLAVTLWGPALEDGFVRIRRVELGATRHELDASGAAPVVRIEAATLPIAPGLEPEPSGAVSPEFLTAFGHSQVLVRVEGEVRRSGTTSLRMTVHTPAADAGDLCELVLELHGT